MGGLSKFFFTFGSSEEFAHQNGWVEIHSKDLDEAIAKFRARFPDRPGHEGTVNCAFWYNEGQWKKMDPEHTWNGWKCFEVIE